MNKFTNWKEYQDETAALFRRQGCFAEVEAQVQGVRAKHEIDVYVSFLRHGIECKWVIECKLWNTKVPKEKVLALKTIVDDVGADRGLIVSEKGFQPGAYDAARFSNISLITSLAEFEKTVLTISYEFPLKYDDKDTGAPIYKFPNKTEPHSLQVHNDYMITANWGSGSISIIDPVNRSIMRTIELDNYETHSPTTGKREIRQYPPGSITIADGKLFVGQVFSDFILAIDLATQAIVKRIYIPGGGEGELTSSMNGKTIYFASNRLNQFYIIDSATYQYKTVLYPEGGRGCMSIFAHPALELLYLGIQRGGVLNGKSYLGGNCFLSVYDLSANQFMANIYLAEIIDGRSDDSTPVCIRFHKSANRIYVGMFQSLMGIYVIDAATNKIVHNRSFEINEYNKYFKWVDPLSLELYGNAILSVNRNNCELAIVRTDSFELVKTVFLGVAPNGPRGIVVFRDEAIISYPERNGLIFLKLRDIT